MKKGFKNVILKNDCLNLVTKLKKEDFFGTNIGLLIVDVFALCSFFNCYVFYIVKREDNKVGYSLTYLQLHDSCNAPNPWARSVIVFLEILEISSFVEDAVR